MNNLLHLLKELQVPAMEEIIFIKPFDEQVGRGGYQTELDLENHSEEQ